MLAAMLRYYFFDDLPPHDTPPLLLLAAAMPFLPAFRRRWQMPMLPKIQFMTLIRAFVRQRYIAGRRCYSKYGDASI